MLEFFTKKAVFQGQDEISQLESIYRVCGTPPAELWNELGLPWCNLIKIKERYPDSFRDKFSRFVCILLFALVIFIFVI
jgi:CTD kinase subunit alpha